MSNVYRIFTKELGFLPYTFLHYEEWKEISQEKASIYGGSAPLVLSTSSQKYFKLSNGMRVGSYNWDGKPDSGILKPFHKVTSPFYIYRSENCGHLQPYDYKCGHAHKNTNYGMYSNKVASLNETFEYMVSYLYAFACYLTDVEIFWNQNENITLTLQGFIETKKYESGMGVLKEVHLPKYAYENKIGDAVGTPAGQNLLSKGNIGPDDVGVKEENAEPVVPIPPSKPDDFGLIF